MALQVLGLRISKHNTFRKSVFAINQYLRVYFPLPSTFAILLFCALPLLLHSQPLHITHLQPESGAPGTILQIYGSGFDQPPADNTLTFTDQSGEEFTVVPDSGSERVLYLQIPDGLKGPAVVSVRRSSDNTQASWADQFPVLSRNGYDTFRIKGAGLPPVIDGATDWGDYNGDGWMDLLITGRDSLEQIIARVYRNDGDTTFTEIGAGLTGVQQGSASWTDFNADGRLDLVLTGRDDTDAPTARLYRNDGDDSFTPVDAGLKGTRFGSTSRGDYNGDGLPDLLITGTDSAFDQTAILYRNEGNGNFTSAEAGLTGVDFSSSDWGDFNGDGRLDLIVTGLNSSATPTTTLYRNDGGGSFTGIYAGLEDVSSGQVDWADFNNDGRLDVAITGENDAGQHTATIYRNDGNGTFSDIAAGLTGVRSSSLAWGDYNGDGFPDLVITGEDESFNPVSVIYKNNGDGTFSDVHAGLVDVSGGSASWTDIEGDGFLDLLVTGADDGFFPKTTLYRNVKPPLRITDIHPRSGAPGTPVRLHGTGFPQPFAGNTLNFTDTDGQTISVTPDSAGPHVLYVRVPSGIKGVVDLSLTKASDDSEKQIVDDFMVLTPGSSDHFTDNDLWGVYFSSMTVGDFYGNGWLDLIATGRRDTELQFYFYVNNGNGNFESLSYSCGDPPDGTIWGSVDGGDYDGDGVLDLVVTGSDGDQPTAKIYHGEVGCIFTEVDAGLTAVQNSSSDWGDYNNDGLLDLVITGNDGNNPTATIYRNDGDSTFIEIDAGLTGVERGSSEWGDYNADGWLDLVIAGSDGSDGTAKIYRNNGDGTFTDIQAGLTGVFESSSSWGDYNGDGMLDLVVTGFYYSSIYRNNGDDSFTKIEASLGGLSQGSSAWGDYDGDGLLDLVITGGSYSEIKSTYIYHNEGDGTFTYINPSIEGVESGAVSWGDFDSDGRLDLAMFGEGDYYSSIGKIYRNAIPTLRLTKMRPKSATTGSRQRLYGSGFLRPAYLNEVAFTDASGNTRTQQADSGDTRLIYLKVPDGFSGSAKVSATRTGVAGGSLLSNLFQGVEAGGGDQFTPIDTLSRGLSDASVSWEDFVGDGLPDLLFTGTDSAGKPATIAYQNNGDTTFASVDLGLTHVTQGSADWGDYNQDGLPDLLLTGRDSAGRPVSIVYRNDGNASFTNIQADIPGVYNGSSKWLDIYPDGWIDLAIAGTDSAGYPVAYVYYNYREQEEFLPYSSLRGLTSGALDWGDLNIDQRIDVVVTGRDSMDNTFTDIYSPGSGQVDIDLAGIQDGTVSLADVDNDGLTDLLVSGATSTGLRTTALYHNEGNWTFTELPTDFAGVRFGSATWGDINGDGYVDLLLTGQDSFGNPVTKLYRNNGDLTFTESDLELAGVHYSDAGMVDVTGDGRLDLIVAGRNASGSPISIIYRNEATGVSIKEPKKQLPGRVQLDPAYPNPFNPTTTIRFSLPRTDKVALTVYNTLGQKVRTLVNQQMEAGWHTVPFEAHSLSSGIYFYRLQMGDFNETHKMLLVK